MVPWRFLAGPRPSVALSQRFIVSCPGSGVFEPPIYDHLATRLRAVERGQKNLAALATQSSYFAALEKQVAGREIEIGLDLNLQLAR